MVVRRTSRYHQSSKTLLILKDQSLIIEAKRIFGGAGIKLTTEGECHFGAVIGSDEFFKSYVKKKVSKWIEDVEQLSIIGREVPQAARSGYTETSFLLKQVFKFSTFLH